MKHSHYIILLTILATTLLLSCNNVEKEITREKITYIKTEKAGIGEFPFQVHATGKLSSKSEQKLSFKTGGIINSIVFDEGLEVKKGTSLAELKFDEIYAQVKMARLGLEKAKRDFTRVKSLFKDSVATLEQYQDMETALNLAESNVKIAEFNLEHSKIIAPSDGKILKRIAEENEMIGPGNPVFLFGANVSDWIIKVNVVDKDLVKIDYEDSVWIYFDAFPNEKYLGFVSEIGSMADPYTGTYEIEIKIIKPNEKFASGFIAKVDIISDEKQKFKLVPIKALLEGNENIGFIYLLHDGQAIKTKIIINHFDNNYLYVTDGVKLNDLIITEGARYITKNSIIKIQNN